ncbi:MAG: hypothetical protein HYR85_00990 [Planctomycetes bacterium]|nr:hypothetical protein [Planctomycetota bacterium]MBI3844802.1 hypothetical protein [Planctomycetota bacterium]
MSRTEFSSARTQAHRQEFGIASVSDATAGDVIERTSGVGTFQNLFDFLSQAPDRVGVALDEFLPLGVWVVWQQQSEMGPVGP